MIIKSGKVDILPVDVSKECTSDVFKRVHKKFNMEYYPVDNKQSGELLYIEQYRKYLILLHYDSKENTYDTLKNALFKLIVMVSQIRWKSIDFDKKLSTLMFNHDLINYYINNVKKYVS